jgi:hypothetical protein
MEHVMHWTTRFLVAAAIALTTAGLKAEEYKSAKVVKIGDKLLVTLEIGGKTRQITAFPFMKAFDKDGQEIGQLGEGLRVLKEGNVLDVRVESMKLTGQAQDYIAEGKLISGELQDLKILRSLTRPLRGAKKPDGTEPAIYTVVQYSSRRPVVLRNEDGEDLKLSESLSKAFDAEGHELPPDERERVLKEGNIIEARLGKLSNSKQQTIKEARLVQGDLLPAPEEKTEVTTVYRGAVLKKFLITGSTIEAGGKTIELASWQSNTKYFDAAGKAVRESANLMKTFTPGSKVDITLGEPLKTGKFPIREIRLVK